MLLAAALGVAEPSADEPGLGPDGGAIGIAWHDQATVAPAIQQRLKDALGDGPIVDDATALARSRVALTLPRARAAKASGWATQLDDATVAYRAGEIERAREEVIAVIDAVRSDPVVPGATHLAWRAQVLRAQLAWAAREAEQTEAALAAAIAIDPDARPSTREVPPPVVEAYDRQRAAVMASAGSWPPLEIVGPDEPFAIEIDGVPGARAVPPGEHLVVVRRPGVEPHGAIVRTGEPWVVPDAEVVLEVGLPADAGAAQRICDHAELRWLVMARLQDDRLGLQRFSCGEGFGAPWYEQRDGWGPGIAGLLVDEPAQGWTAAAVLHLDEPWPPLRALSRPPAPRIVADGGPPQGARARLRRALPWLLISGVVAGSVTVGVLLGTDAGADLAIDGKSFFGR